MQRISSVTKREGEYGPFTDVMIKPLYVPPACPKCGRDLQFPDGRVFYEWETNVYKEMARALGLMTHPSEGPRAEWHRQDCCRLTLVTAPREVPFTADIGPLEEFEEIFTEPTAMSTTVIPAISYVPKPSSDVVVTIPTWDAGEDASLAVYEALDTRGVTRTDYHTGLAQLTRGIYDPFPVYLDRQGVFDVVGHPLEVAAVQLVAKRHVPQLPPVESHSVAELAQATAPEGREAPKIAYRSVDDAIMPAMPGADLAFYGSAKVSVLRPGGSMIFARLPPQAGTLVRLLGSFREITVARIAGEPRPMIIARHYTPSEEPILDPLSVEAAFQTLAQYTPDYDVRKLVGRVGEGGSASI